VIVFLTNVFSTLYMTGLIWFVQVVHYPLFAYVAGDFVRYEQLHTVRTGWVVAPVMLAELGSSALLVLNPRFMTRTEASIGLAFVIALWVSTWALQVPQHTTLARGYDAAAQQFLVSSNWLRTALWSVRSGLLLYWLGRALSAAA
jgi:hypothetical protein